MAFYIIIARFLIACEAYGGTGLVSKNKNMNQVDIKLSKMQLIHLGNICKKRMGWL